MNNPFDLFPIAQTEQTENVNTLEALKTKFIIEDLKKQIAASDYKVIKCHEYALCSLELPYDVKALHAERQALRDKINELEGGG